MLWQPDQEAIIPPFTILDVDITWTADWRDVLPQIFESDGVPLDLTGKELHWFFRPTYDFTSEFLEIANIVVSGLGPFILFDDAVNGLASVAMPRADVQAQFSVGAWNHFLLLKEGTAWWELGRGPFLVHPGLTTFA